MSTEGKRRDGLGLFVDSSETRRLTRQHQPFATLLLTALSDSFMVLCCCVGARCVCSLLGTQR